MTSSSTTRDSPGVLARPPLILLGALLLGLALDWAWPAPFLPSAIQYTAGAALIALAGTLAGSAIRCFVRAGTNVPTNRPATALVIAGPYRFSRNPIYVGMITLLLGIGIMVDSPWLVALVPAFALILRYGVIAREELYLEAKFGDSYRAYKSRVRRWL